MLTRRPCGRSSTRCADESAATATTTRIGNEVAFEYCISPRLTTSLAVSSTQSRPVMPMSNRPSATYVGISCGRRMRTSAMRGSSIDGLVVDRRRPHDRQVGRLEQLERRLLERTLGKHQPQHDAHAIWGQCDVGSELSRRSACGRTSRIAASCSTQPFGEPGVLQMIA